MTINSVFATFKLRLLAFSQQQRFFSSEFVSCSRSVRVEHTKGGAFIGRRVLIEISAERRGAYWKEGA